MPEAKGQDSLRLKQSFFSKMFFPDSTQLIRYRVVPFVNYAPETRLGFGAGIIINWDYKDAAPKTNSSLAQSFLYYTQNNQIDWTSKFEIFTNRNRFSFSGSIGYIKFPQNYFGVGNYIPFDQREKFSFQQVYFDIKSRVRLRKGFYVGIDYYFNTNYDVQWPEGSQFEGDPSLYGTQGYLISGIGPEVVLDTRDYPLNPSKGSYMSASLLFFSDVLGSEYSYNYYQLDLRHFFLLNKKKRWVLGVQLYGLFAKGEAPFNRIPALGGPEIMRGYYSGRFRDHNYIAGQVEWRMPVWRFIGITAWMGTGQVASNFNEFAWTGFKPNAGIGLRFMIDKRSKMNVRADQGFGTNTKGFYLRINEAF
jgi:outer membrane protein assembly factor BamA